MLELEAFVLVKAGKRLKGRKDFARRSQLKICMDMLSVVNEGSEGPTQIKHRANLSWVALETHLETLV